MKRRGKGKMEPVNQQRTIHAYSLVGHSRQHAVSEHTIVWRAARTRKWPSFKLNGTS
jgi:hypothetical protein